MKYFPFTFELPKPKENPKKWHLTISAILEKNKSDSEIFKVQDRILKNIPTVNIVGNGIYKYPKDRVHFSIINFPDLGKTNSNFIDFSKEREEIIDKIQEVFLNFNGKFEKKAMNNIVEFAYIYPHSSDSLAIQAFLGEDLIKFLNKMTSEFIKIKGIGKVILKSYPYHGEQVRMPVNIARFFRELTTEESKLIGDNANEYNNLSMSQNLDDMKLSKLSFVVSDDWLSNDDFEVLTINL